MFKGINKNAQEVINVLSQKEAKALNHALLFPEHVMLAILKSGNNFAIKALKNLNFDIHTFGLHIVSSIGSGSNTLMAGGVLPSPRLQKVLMLSTKIAKEMNQDYVGVEHLLLGMYEEGTGAIYKLLFSAKITKNMLRLSVMKEIGGFVSNEEEFSKNVKVKTPILDQYSIDLTEQALKDEIDPVIGRDQEIERVIQILSRRTKSNPILVGEPGVGKTAIVEGLAYRIITKKVPLKLYDKRVCVLQLSSIIAGTKYRGEFEERILNILTEIKKASDIILFIDEAHTILGAGGAEGAIDASNLLKPALARGGLHCIAATTLVEFRKYFEKDAALVRRFQVVDVEEPSVDDAIKILHGLKKKYEEFHRVKYTDSALESAVKLSYRYLTEKKLPDKAIDILDEAGAQAGVKQFVYPEEIVELEENINSLDELKDKFIYDQDYEKAAEYRDKIQKLANDLQDQKALWESKSIQSHASITPKEIQSIISKISKIPLKDIQQTEAEKLVQLEDELTKRVVGQDKAVEIVSNTIRRVRLGFTSKNRPNGTFLFAGPTGVGKTELAKAIAQLLFGSDERLIRIDMSEFMEKHSVSRLIGSPPGYVGYEEGGVLTSKIRQNPFSVILFDEIEKAHPDVFNILLQIMEEGELSDHKSHRVDFRNTMIILTSNVASRELLKGGAIGFSESIEEKNSQKEKQCMKKIEEFFEPEFLNRLDDIVLFQQLDQSSIEKITKLLLNEFRNLALEQEVDISFTDDVITFIAKDGFDENFGARPVRRSIVKHIEDDLSKALLDGTISKDQKILIDCIDDELTFQNETENGE
ncbi:MAG: ATP-dependent Clp protease ATP-binding subunit ClpC [Planctomycetota bacterium]|nr:MAG: ATP-dependent Clp protease ATP-binding subunit ClpC [Planctomycetota bacterium]